MRLLYINPNSTEAMTDSIVQTARAAAPDTDILGWTNHDGPPAIQGPADGEAAVEGILSLLPRARTEEVSAIIIACFDDTGLAQVRDAAHCPVIGIGQAAMAVASVSGGDFAIVTTLDVSVPVISENVKSYAYEPQCVGVFASGIPVLDVEAGGEAVKARLVATINQTGAKTIVLGCAGMSHLKADLEERTNTRCVDGVMASVRLAQAVSAGRKVPKLETP